MINGSRFENCYSNDNNIIREEQIRQRREFQKKEEIKKINSFRKKLLTFIMISLLIATSVFIIKKIKYYHCLREEQYISAIELFNGMRYDEALEVFNGIKGNYKEKQSYVSLIEGQLDKYQCAVELMDNEDFSDAIKFFSELGQYNDSEKHLMECSHQLVAQLKNEYEAKQYDTALVIARQLPVSVYGEERINELISSIEYEIKNDKYETAVDCYNNNNYLEAKSLFCEIIGFSDSEAYLDSIYTWLFNTASNLYSEKKYQECLSTLDKIDSYWKENEVCELEDRCIYSNKTDIEEAALMLLKNGGTYYEFEQYLMDHISSIYTMEMASILLEEYTPVDLSSLPILDESICGVFDSSYTYCDKKIDNLNITHRNVLIGSGGRSNSDYPYISYYVNGKYDVLSGCLFWFQGCTQHDCTLKFEVRDENDAVLFSTILAKGSMPQNFNINISHAQVIKITLYGYVYYIPGGSYYYGGVSDLNVRVMPDL